ncbi:MAG: hypothetical protein N3B21_07865 [Clostridia bacterium]|nr:hypothetical protein [Clostridia bacterium]
MAILIILVYLLIGYVEIVPLIKAKKTKEIWGYSVFFLLPFLFSILIYTGLDIPNPADPIKKAVTSIVGR